MYKDCDHENMDIPKLNVLHQISLPQDSKNHDKLLKYGSEEKGSSFCKCSILLGFIMSKKLRGL